MERQRKNKIKKLEISIIYILLAFCFLFISFLSPVSFIVFAEDSSQLYTYVLDDLSTVEDFDIEDYPINKDDGSLQVIQIAESSDNELFVYVYQPSESLIATRVSMSIDQGENYILYDLTLLNSSSVFFKYKLTNFILLDDEYRYYNVASIYRVWNEEYDGKTDTEIEKAFKVGQTMFAVGFGKDATFEYQNVEVVEISAKTASNVVSFKNDFFSWMSPGQNGFCSHIVAFSTDLPIDQIFEAEVYATYQYSTYVYYHYGLGYVPSDREDKPYSLYKTLTYDEIASVSKKGTTYQFNRIMRVSDYLAVLDDEDIFSDEDLEPYQWVLCLSEAKDFFTYEYTGIGFGYGQIGGTLLQSASILKLKFDMGGITYNLGVVDNISSSDFYSNIESWFDKFVSWLKSSWKNALIIIGAVVGLIIFAPLLPWIIKGFFVLLFWLCKAVWIILTLPFRLLNG